MKRKVCVVAAAGFLAAGVVAATPGLALAKTTVELTVNHSSVRSGHPVTFTALATTDSRTAPKSLRLCLQEESARHAFGAFGKCTPVTSRPHGQIDIFVIHVTFHSPGRHIIRAVAVRPGGTRWTAPSTPVTVTVH